MDYARMVFVTCNVESLIAKPDLISDWSTSVAREITEQKPTFASVHLQGLRTKGVGADTADQLIKDLDGQADMDMFESSRIFYDLDHLGLCSLYYVKDEAHAALFDNKKQQFWTVEGRQTDSPSSAGLRKETLDNGYLSPTAQEPASFMMSRWLLFDNKPFTFVNLSLTGDQSPLEGCLEWPSESCLQRQKELQSLIDNLNLFDEDAILMSGNYNCSLTKDKLLKEQSAVNSATIENENDSDGYLCKYEASSLGGKKIFSLDSTKFDFGDSHDWLFATCKGQLIKKYDQELLNFKGPLYEPNVFFAPTYPYEWDRMKNVDVFSRNDCPGWKSRILLNKTSWELMHHDSFSSSGMYYGLVGNNVNIGAHKVEYYYYFITFNFFSFVFNQRLPISSARCINSDRFRKIICEQYK